ncbi:XrtY-associated glycosyltransferase XYAG1 [Pedobacter sp. SAFR-022]|uniref:XrtY-associated glycosyltransferase XYAG1 n=1 Tax=Pedobacter sp. SAFR-022 TaxID=3436861 RepID=UPI003F7E0A3D
MLNKRITVLHITPSYKPAYCYGGPTRSIAMLCEAANVPSAKIEALVFTTTANGNRELDFKSGVKQNVDGVDVYYYSRLSKDHTHFSPALLFALHRFLQSVRRNKQELIIHIHSWWNLVAILSAALAVCHRMPMVISPRGMITPYTLSFRHKAAKYLVHSIVGRLLLQTAHLHATTALEAKNLLQYLPTGNISIIPNLLTFDTVENRCQSFSNPINGLTKRIPEIVISKPNEQQLRLIFLSRIDPKKGLEVLFEALAITNFPWTLTIAGMGKAAYLRYLKQLSGSLKISSNISWIGQVEDVDKFELLNRHDLLTLTSSNENFGNVVLEALLAGTSVLLSDQVGLAHYIQEADLGWICKAEPKEIASTLSLINLDQDKRSRIKCMAPQQIRKDFNTADIMENYLSLYKKVLSRMN